MEAWLCAHRPRPNTRRAIQCYEHLILPGHFFFYLASDSRWLLKLRKHSIGQTPIVPSSLSHIVEQTLSELCCCLGQATGSGLGWEIWRNGLWPFHKYKGTFFVSRRAVICSTGFLIAARFKKSAEFGCCLCPHLAPLTHFRGVLTFQDTCLASVRLPICSQLTQPSHFYEATLFRMASCPPNCITFYMLCPGIPLLAKGCQNLIRHIRGPY